MKKKKPYSKPILKKIGTIRDLTTAMSLGASADGAAPPLPSKKACITPAPQIDEHRHLLMDDITQNQFRRAIMQKVKPGDVVLDLGTGSGLHALFACQAGAKKVYAVDIESIVEVAKETAFANNFGDRIEFIMGKAHDIELPEKVDAIITNVGFLNTLTTLPDMVRYHLKPGGKIIPTALELNFTFVNVPDFYSSRVSFWDNKIYDLDFSAFRQMASHHPLYTEYKTDELLMPSQSLGRIELSSVVDDYMERTVTFTADFDGVAHGLGGWYHFWNDGEILMSTEPPIRMDRDVWRNIFLPFEQPLSFRKGERFEFQIGMYARGGYRGPFWRWKGKRDGNVIVDQCSFYATPLSKQIIEKIAVQ